MPIDLFTKTCLVYDNGLFVELAVRLARDFARVYYYCPWKSSFPTVKELAVGEGIEGVTRVYNLWDVIDKVDLFVFPDVFDGDLQVYLRQIGKRVWGSGNAEYLELDRIQAKKVQKEVGVRSPPFKVVLGLDQLRRHLAKPGNVFVKTNGMYRGDIETFQHKDPEVTKPMLDDLATKYGPKAGQIEFLVEDAVEGYEIAYDGFTVDGQFPARSLWGVEIKDEAYVGRMTEYANLPDQVREVNSRFAPVLRVDQCRSFVSFEMRVTDDGTPFVIDPCMRCGNPPTEVWMELYDNLGEIFWEGADGKIVDPEPVAEYAAMVVIHSARGAKGWTPIHVPADLERWVKIRFLCMVDDNRYYVPNRFEMIEVGAVVAVADSAEEAVALVTERAEIVDADGLNMWPEKLDRAVEKLETAEARG